MDPPKHEEKSHCDELNTCWMPISSLITSGTEVRYIQRSRDEPCGALKGAKQT